MADETPDPADEAAVKDVADAIHRAFKVASTDDWDHEARAAIAAARPHLTAEREAEVARLRKQIDDVVSAITEYDRAGRFAVDDIPYRAGDIFRATAAEADNLRKYTETTKHHQDQHAAAVRDLDRVRREVRRLVTAADPYSGVPRFRTLMADVLAVVGATDEFPAHPAVLAEPPAPTTEEGQA